jgi:outer membrane lipoprotein SlyB
MTRIYRKPIPILWTIGLLAFFLAGCAPSKSGRVYSRDQARVQHSVYYGTVLEVDEVLIEGTKTPIGTIAGGAALGSTIGGGSGRTVATVLGGIVGGIAGSAAEEGVTRRDGLELTVELDNGQIISVVQEADDQFLVGDRVRIVKGPGGSTRVRQ